MAEDDAAHADLGDIEEIIRAAGGYLEVSDDLRPRTLEEARYRGRETSNRSWIAIVAVVIVFLTIYAGRVASSSPLKGVVSSGGDQLYAAAGQKTAQASVDPNSTLADALSELRQRQVSLIEDAFWH